MSTSVIQKYVDTYEKSLHSGVISNNNGKTEQVHYDLWVTDEEFKELKYWESLAMQTLERRLISEVRWHRNQGMWEKLDCYSRLLAQLRGGKFHPYKLAWDYITLTNV